MFFFINDVEHEFNEINLILHRIFDASLSFFLTLAVGFFSLRIVHQIVKSAIFQQTSSSSTTKAAKSTCGNPLFRILVSMALVHGAIFAYDLAKIVGYDPENKNQSSFVRCWSLECFLENFIPFWSLETEHNIVQQILAMVEITFICLWRMKKPRCFAAAPIE